MKVAYFTRFIPHYRQDVFEELGAKENIQFDIYASYKYKGGFSLINPAIAHSFKFFNSKTHEIKLFKISIYFQGLLIYHIFKGNYDVFITSFKKSNLSVWVALLLCRLLNRKILLWGHGTYKNRIGYFIKKLMFNLSSGILLYDDNTKERWLKMGAKRTKVFVVHNSVNTISIDNVINQITNENLQNTLSTFNPKNTPNIIFTGRLQKRRNLENLFEAIRIINNGNQKVRLLIIGDGPEKERLFNLTKEKEIEGNVIFLGELYDEKEVAKIFLSSVCAVIPGWIGLFVQHSFCYGLPVIISDNKEYYGPEASLVENNINGLVYQNNSVEDLAFKIKKVISDEKFLSKLSTNAKNTILTKYNATIMADDFYHAIHKIMI